jgi:hypothetical protein
VRADLLVSVTGDADRVAMTLHRKAGRRYKRVRSLRGRKIKPGSTLVALKLGKLRVGRYRIAVTVSKSGLKQATTQVKFRAAAGRR